MIIYYGIFCLSFLLCIFDFIKESKIKLVVYIIFTCTVTLIAGLRTIGVDNDSVAYQQIFLSSDNLSFYQIFIGDYWENTERGFYLLNKLINSLGGNSNTLLLLIAILTGYLNYSIIYKISPYPFLSILFYLSFFYLYRDFTQIRYGLGCALIFYTIYYFVKKKYIFFFTFLCLSFLFHNTSYIVIIILPFCSIFRNKLIYFYLPIIGLIGLFYNFLPLLLSLGGGLQYLQIYLDETGTAGLMIPLIGSLIMIIYVFNEKKLLLIEKNHIWYNMFFKLFAISVTLNFLFFQVSIFQRFSYLFFQFGILLLPMMLKDLKFGRYKIYYNLLYFGFASFFLYYGIRMINPDLVRPYFK
ncbi:EpsG family protein [Flavobacterium sp. ARAG 55.4]|uniref:EpsG family protein n=1 Tax=Flavobacterium sp. ARAG 55.4 TaxID=3451357 RepID=UPI003F4657E2